MIARFHYDRKTLTRFLDEEAGSETAEIASHVEQCEECQSALESLMGDGLTMDKAGELLRGSASFQLPDLKDGKPEACPTFLQSSDDPGSIGRFARYEIKRILGRGGMGIVMQALDTSLGRHCAVKVLVPELASSAASRRRFSREARSAAAVVHPHVVPIQTVDEYNGIPYLVMPVVEGQSLQQRVDADGPLSVIETVRIASQVAEGLAAAHDQGLVHRDIKPANVLLENGVERVQITDFGLARAVDDASMTRSGVIAGTPQYMSPEQAHGDTIDHRSDLFSLGSLTYFMLAGRSPFRAETTMGVLNRIGNDEPRGIRSINADAPQWLEQIVLRLLSKSPDDRFQSAAEVAELLQNWHAHLQQPDIMVRPPEPTALAAGLPTHTSTFKDSADSSRGRFTKWLIATAALACFAVLATVIVLETNKGTIRIESNSRADVPIRIIQGQKIVDQLSVSLEGATTRLSAGNYRIEVDGEATDVHLSGDRVTLKRGETWLAKIDVRLAADTVREWNAYGFGDRNGPNSIDVAVPNYQPEKAFATQKHPAAKFVPILGPTTQGGNVSALDPPSEQEILRVLESQRLANGNIPSIWKTRRENLRITKEKIADYIDPPRMYPLIGPAQLHHAHYKCTVYFDGKQKIDHPIPHSIDERDVIKVVYIDHKHFHLISDAPSRFHSHGKSQTAGASEDTNSLTVKVEAFNRRMIASDGDDHQPLLTVDELLSLSRWKLQTDSELSVEVNDLLTDLGIGRYLPEQWMIEGGQSEVVTDDGEIKIYTIELVNRYTHSKVLVRKRYRAPPVNFQAPRQPAAIERATPLAAAITEFNAMHHSVDGKRQPPLTVDEVLAAIVDWNSRRNEASVDNKTFASFQEIALTHQIPDGAKLAVIPSFGSLDGDTFRIWSVRIVMPQVAKPGHTDAFLIRQQYISVDSATDGVVHWGKPNDVGLQAGVRLIPGQRSYQVGQSIKTEFVYRSISGKAIDVTIPNIFSHQKLIAKDANGNALDVVEVEDMTIGGAVETEIGEKPTVKRGKPLALGYITPVWGFDIGKGHPAETNLTVTDGLECFLTYVVSDLDGGELQTGEVVFEVAGHKTDTSLGFDTSALQPGADESRAEPAEPNPAFATPHSLMTYYTDCQFRDDELQDVQRNKADELEALLARSMIDNAPTIAKAGLSQAAASIRERLQGDESREPTQNELILTAATPSMLKNPRQFVLEFDASDEAVPDEAKRPKRRKKYEIETDAKGVRAIDVNERSRMELKKIDGRWWIDDPWAEDEETGF
ncbi:serine/threonine-protein kinase [Rhodopirellula sp. JC639]|uniref:serine/threonine-protein kinase n=1 Tax=Stieleria mannarensis TaxID=2755585 RepID=UPI0016031566|nr:serine/threonine-protein kinase [Rhodopirellula sp. JC639]